MRFCGSNQEAGQCDRAENGEDLNAPLTPGAGSRMRIPVSEMCLQPFECDSRVTLGRHRGSRHAERPGVCFGECRTDSGCDSDVTPDSHPRESGCRVARPGLGAYRYTPRCDSRVAASACGPLRLEGYRRRSARSWVWASLTPDLTCRLAHARSADQDGRDARPTAHGCGLPRQSSGSNPSTALYGT